MSTLVAYTADDYISPELLQITTPIYKASLNDFQPRFGTYEYSVSWEGIPAASCSLTLKQDHDRLIVTAAARTYSAIDLLYKLRYSAEASLSKHDLTSMRLQIDHRENSRRREITIDFSEDMKRISVLRSSGEAAYPEASLAFSPHNFTLDPISAAFISRALPWSIGETKILDVFNGTSRYYIELTAIRRETLRFHSEDRRAIIISPRIRNLTNSKPVSKLREAFIYLSDDPYREVLQIVSSVMIGKVTTSLDSFTPLSEAC